MQIIIKRYEHFNTALPNWNTPKGVYVKSKEHYDRLVKEAGMVSYDENASGPKEKEYRLSEKAKAIIQAARNSSDKRGRVKLSDNTVKAMKEIGAIGKKIPDYMKLPSKYQPNGSFSI